MKTKLNGPFQPKIDVLIINDKTKEAGTVTVGMDSFMYPTAEMVKQSLTKLDFKKGALKGFRLMTKREAVNYIITGEPNPEMGYAVPGSQSWEE